jgi:shikimate kinase
MIGPRPDLNLALVGFMGTGKSSVGRVLAVQLDYAFLDTDVLIEERTGTTIARIFSEKGEPAFRAMEQDVVRGLEQVRRTVIATGGGLIAEPGNLESLRRHSLVVCLWASAEAVWERVRHQEHRPLLRAPDPLARIRELLARREPFYRQADVLVNTDQRTPREVAQHVLHEFRLACAGTAP